MEKENRQAVEKQDANYIRGLFVTKPDFQKWWPLRLMVRTPLFQGGDTGSSPVGVTAGKRLGWWEALFFLFDSKRLLILNGKLWQMQCWKRGWQWLPLCLLSLTLAACASAPRCENLSATGNLASLNSPADDLAPLPYASNVLIFTSDRSAIVETDSTTIELDNDQPIFLTSTQYRDGWAEPAVVQEPPVNHYGGGAGATYFYDSANGITNVFFAAPVSEGNFDLFVVSGSAGQWSKPRPLTVLNSPYWDGYPAIAPDGSYLLFVSDRPQGQGGLDLYIAFRLSDSLWSIPQPLRELNSRWDEMSPVIDRDGTLYFATQAMSAQRTFDIVRATPTGAGQWSAPELLPFPINTNSDEITPQLWGDSLLLSSNRPGGCGGFDLYAFPLCPPVQVIGTVFSDPGMHSRERIVAIDHHHRRFAETAVQSDGRFQLQLPARRQYQLVYENPCYSGDPIIIDVTTPCTLQPTVIRADFTVPPFPTPEPTFPFTVDIPYFVPGYHKLTTLRNLRDLRLLLEMNLLSSKHAAVAYPDSSYDLYAQIVQKQLDIFRDQLQQALQAANDPCQSQKSDLLIIVEGYASPKEIPEHARYIGVEIWDEHHNLFVTPKMPLTPTLLARLRAYFVLRFLQQILSKDPQWKTFADHIRWKIAGSVTPDAGPEQRKVRILITNAEPLQKL